MTRFSVMRFGVILTFVVALTAGVVFGQQVTGTILGQVTDTSGSVVPGATIQVQNPAIGFSRTETADTDGRYLSANLPLGSYSVTVQKEGFQTLVHNGIVLSVGSAVTVNAELVVGNVQQRVEVTGEALQVETTNATVSSLVDPEQIRNLPLNGRSVDSLALLAPGVFANRATSVNATVGLGLHITVNGNRQEYNLYLLDGTVTNDVNSGRSSAAGEALGVEGILEFRLVTHDGDAEYGRVAGGIFSAVTRSGTNEFHGSAYEFVRNTIFNAQNVFNQSATVPAFQRNQFGAAAGGPILKNKLFFFANYEGLRQRQAIPITSFVPDDASRAAAVLAIQPYLVYYPHINVAGSDVGGIGRSNINYSEPTREDYTMVRLDYKISDKDSFFARYVYDPSTIVTPQPVPTFVQTLSGDDRFLVLSETHIFSPSTLNEFRFAVNRTRPSQVGYPAIDIPASLSFVPGQPFGAFTFSQSVGGSSALSPLGTSPFSLELFPQNLITESDTVTKVWGAHTVKFGVDVEREQINNTGCFGCDGQFIFSGLTSLLNAMPTGYNSQAAGLTPAGTISNGGRGWRRILFGSFVQDDIRLRRNLTVNLGLRYEFFTNVSEVHGWTSTLLNVTDSKNTPGPPFISPKLNFAPRVGIAWDPTGSGKTSVRLGAGLYDDELTGQSWFINTTRNADFLTLYHVNNPPFPNGLANGVGSALLQDSRVQYYPQQPTVYEWSLDVQRQLAPTLSFKVGYIGSHGVHMPSEAELNTKAPTVNPDGSLSFASTALFINPRFASLQTTLTNGVYSYNGIQVWLMKSLSAGLTFQASYTYSKTLSNSDEVATGQTLSSPTVFMNPFNPAQDYSLSAWDQRHTLVVNGAYQMPWDHKLNNGVAKAVLGGWAVNGIYSYGSGLPLTIQDGFNNSRDGDANNPDRPSLTPGFSQNPTSGVTAGCGAVTVNGVTTLAIPAGQPLHTPTRWFDPCAFTVSPPGTFGNLGRNTVIGPGLSNVDFSLLKLTALTERTKLEFRAEFFNLFNHPQFGMPGNAIASSPTAAMLAMNPVPTNYSGNAGAITTTSVDNRELQLGLKLIF